ncbi:MAG TPA: BadF/BadG/BcrA/BcrD ATPase family protein [Pyrinomonadaceae bacterium]|nr:BadF/BadG/BcrA/BcrD ATPase family protein [Pyrinomonadaceae bacterium]
MTKFSHNLYLGADGGGTKTHIVLIDERKNLVGEGFSGASNPLRVGLETAVSNIIQAINQACDKAQISRGDIVSAVLGLAGVRRDDLKRGVRDRFVNLTHIRKTEVVTDAEIALYGTTLGKAGVVIIAGTGSICYGKDANGHTETAGGWGPIAGDEGGGAGIAKRALQAIAKATDGRGKSTKLSEAGMEYFRSSTPQDLLIAIYSPNIDNARIAGFARYVVETAQAGDEIAQEILKEAGFELGLAAFAVLKKLKLQNRKVPIGQVGSIFKAGNLLTDSLMKTVHKLAPKAFLANPKLSPANAAAVMAFENFRKGEK